MAKVDKEQRAFEKNYASDQSVCDRFMQRINGSILNARANRRQKEEVWLEDLRLYRCRTSALQNYQGRANLFIPEMHHQIENSVDKFMGGLFPSQNWMGSIPTKGTTEEEAENLKAALMYEFEVRNGFKAIVERHERQKVLYGTSPMKIGFDRQFSKIFTKDRKGRVVRNEIPIWNGLRLELIDIFRWYIYPETSNMQTYDLVFEDMLVEKRLLKDMKNLANLSSLEAQPKLDLEHFWVDQERLEMTDICTVMDMRPSAVFLTEMYLDFDLEEGNFEKVKALVANYSTPIEIRRNPSWYQTDPYAVSRYMVMPSNDFYGMSLPDRIRSMQYQINDVANQSMDSVTYSLNPIAVIDPARAGDVNSFKVQPGAKWWGDPDGIAFKIFPDVSQVGYAAMSQIRGMIAQFSDTSPGIAPQLQGKARSATQADLVQKEVSSDLKVALINETRDFLVPMFEKGQSLLVQYQDKNYQIRIQGPDHGSWIMKEIKPEDLIGNVDWYWVGNEIAERSAVRSQQLISFFNVAANAVRGQAVPPGAVDLPKLLEYIAKDFKIDNIDEVMTGLKEKKTVDAEIENIALTQEQEVVVHMADDDDEHIQVHLSGMESTKDEDEKISFAKHISVHRAAKQAKAQLKQKQAQLQQLQQAQLNGASQGPEGGPSSGQGPDGGNPAQVSTNPAQLTQGVRASQPNI